MKAWCTLTVLSLLISLLAVACDDSLPPGRGQIVPNPARPYQPVFSARPTSPFPQQSPFGATPPPTSPFPPLPPVTSPYPAYSPIMSPLPSTRPQP